MIRSNARRVAQGSFFSSLLVVAVVLLHGRSPSCAGDPPPPAPSPIERVRGERFATSTVCARCHSLARGGTALRDAKERNVAPWDLWRSSQMASSSRDPLWRAAVAAEVAATPSLREQIEATCLRCHAPMLAREREAAGEKPRLADLDGADDLAQLGRDGVSCVACHRIAPDRLGEPSSFTGGFELAGERRAFGPHEDPFVNPMHRQSGFEPREGSHVMRSALCGTCHTVLTESVAANGSATGAVLPEQTPYLEWRNSAFQDETEDRGPEATSCQGCHLPTRDADGAPIRTAIARMPCGRDFGRVEARSPFGRHVLVGGNALVPATLRDLAAPVDSAVAEGYGGTAAEARARLGGRTADLTIDSVSAERARLSFRVNVAVKTGHKFPTGHPSRRAWLRVRVLDAEGRTVFSSGAFDDAGRILGVSGKSLPSEESGGPVEPHRARVTAGDEVPIFESVMADAGGAPTWRLFRGARFLKDDRLLPRGFRPRGADVPLTAPVGTEGDPDFAAGGDSVSYDVDAPGARRIEADLLYETAGARFLAELLEVDAPEVRTLRTLLERADRKPVPVATVAAEVRGER